MRDPTPRARAWV